MNIYKDVAITGRVRACLSSVTEQKPKGKVIVDVGCSNGLLAYLVLPMKPKKFIGIDPSERAIKVAKKNIKTAIFFQSVAGDLPVKANYADIALMFDVIEHVPKNSEIQALQEINRVLKKGGKLLLSTPHNHWLMNLLDPAWYLGHRHYHVAQVKGYLKKSGFKVETAVVKGGRWFSISLLVLYIQKWIFKNPRYRNHFLEVRDDNQFSKPHGIHTIFIVAKKI